MRCAYAVFTVEKFLKNDRAAILERQKAEALANGEEWIAPEERLRLEEEEANRIADEARKAELKAKCERKGLDFGEQEAQYQARLAQKRRRAEEKKRQRKNANENDLPLVRRRGRHSLTVHKANSEYVGRGYGSVRYARGQGMAD